MENALPTTLLTRLHMMISRFSPNPWQRGLHT